MKRDITKECLGIFAYPDAPRLFGLPVLLTHEFEATRISNTVVAFEINHDRLRMQTDVHLETTCSGRASVFIDDAWVKGFVFQSLNELLEKIAFSFHEAS